MQCKHCKNQFDSIEEHVVEEHLTDSKELLFCDNCDKPYAKYSYRVSDSSNCCSRECADKFKAKDGLDTKCSECNSKIHIPPSQIKEVDGYEQKNYFCDKSCESSFKSREWVGENHPSWDGGKVRNYCDECNSQYMVIKSEKDKRKYCSTECMYKAQSIEKEEYDCVNCETTVKRYPYNVKCDNVLCSEACLKEHFSNNMRGEDNPQWKGGRFEYYGPNWNEQREKALERDDYECQECEMTIGEHIDQFDQELHIHHKVPRRQIIDEDNPTMDQFELANSLNNLVTLCNSCHKKLED